MALASPRPPQWFWLLAPSILGGHVPGAALAVSRPTPQCPPFVLWKRRPPELVPAGGPRASKWQPWVETQPYLTPSARSPWRPAARHPPAKMTR